MTFKSFSYRRAVLSALHRLGDARLCHIAAAMGHGWANPKMRSGLRRMLWTMEQEGLVTRPSLGVFRSTVGVGRGGLGCGSEIIRAIATYIRDQCGELFASDLVEQFIDRRIWGPDERSSRALEIIDIVRKADCFRLDGDRIGLISEQPSAVVARSVLKPLSVPNGLSHHG